MVFQVSMNLLFYTCIYVHLIIRVFPCYQNLKIHDISNILLSCINIGDAEEPDLAVIPGPLDDNVDEKSTVFYDLETTGMNLYIHYSLKYVIILF